KLAQDRRKKRGRGSRIAGCSGEVWSRTLCPFLGTLHPFFRDLSPFFKDPLSFLGTFRPAPASYRGPQAPSSLPRCLKSPFFEQKIKATSVQATFYPQIKWGTHCHKRRVCPGLPKSPRPASCEPLRRLCSTKVPKIWGFGGKKGSPPWLSPSLAVSACPPRSPRRPNRRGNRRARGCAAG
uniref:Uncharacterized protein n=1 Tax=Anas platyrhynchos platyrhynchos TaxID=8840 RepID=A0A493TF09_ANAPP